MVLKFVHSGKQNKSTWEVSKRDGGRGRKSVGLIV